MARSKKSGNAVTTKVRLCVRVAAGLAVLAATVTAYVPGVVLVVVEMLRLVEAGFPAVGLTEAGVNKQVDPAGNPLVHESVTAWLNDPIALTCNDVALDVFGRFALIELGLGAPKLKSTTCRVTLWS